MKNKLKLVFNNFEQVTCGILLSLIMFLLFSQTILRYFFGQTFAWSEELSRFAFLALVFISSSLGVQKSAHIRVTAHIDLLPKKAKLLLSILTDIIWIIFNIVVIQQGYKLIDQMATLPLRSAAMMWDMRFIFILIPLGFLLQTIRILQSWFVLYLDNFKGANRSGS